MNQRESIWASAQDTAGEWKGHNDSGIEMFAGNPMRYAAGELSQNTKDAGTNLGKIVRLKYECIDVPLDDIPNIDGFREIIQACVDSDTDNNPKAKQFYDKALDLLSGETIPVLLVSDYNTKGLRGPCERNNPYYTYMKTVGSSQKDNETASGSFGIGKAAPFLLSDFRAIMVSTVYPEGGVPGAELKSLVQGKSVLSYYELNGHTHTNSVYWGNPDGFMPISSDSPDVPWFMKRFEGAPTEDDVGTTIAVLGFNKVEGWEKLIIAYSLQTLFPAIHSEEMIVEVGDIVISKETLSDLFDDEEISLAVENSGESSEDYLTARAGHMALAACAGDVMPAHGEWAVVCEEVPGLGEVSLKLLVQDELPQKVIIVRNGMFITANLDGLRQFRSLQEFACVVNFEDKAGSEVMRSMEPPAHDNFEASRHIHGVKEGEKILKNLSGFVREKLRLFAAPPTCEDTNLTELSEFLADESAADKDGGEGEVNPMGVLKISDVFTIDSVSGRRKGKISTGKFGGKKAVAGGDVHERSNPENLGGDGSSSAVGEKSEGGGLNSQSNGEEGEGERLVEGNGEGKKVVSLTLGTCKGIQIAPNRYRLIFAAPVVGQVRFEFERIGYGTNLAIAAVATNKGEIIDGKLVINAEENAKEIVDVDFVANFRGGLKVKAHAI
ncbi:hypothetical protein [Mesorhizobium sp. SP-1A]|uniref:hypothetical protein n=1 Tax=Mesorhizobium sp. SP-1A TaxID=3077840 RepID=UPI0028F6C707|nr:hypothetical protein [Mesorhizobium sp. SP-1A]